MDPKQIGSDVAKFLGDNAVEIVAGAITIGAGVAVAKAGTAAVTTACLVGGGLLAVGATFVAAKSLVQTAMLAPAAMQNMYQAAKTSMESKPQRVANA